MSWLIFLILSGIVNRVTKSQNRPSVFAFAFACGFAFVFVLFSQYGSFKILFIDGVMKHTEVSHCFKVVLFIQKIQEMFTVFLLRCVIEYFIHFIVGVGRTRFNTVQTFYFVLYPGKQRKFAIIGIFLVYIFKPSSQNTSFSIEPSFRFCKYSQSPSLSLVKNMYNGLDLPVVGRLPEVTWSNKSSQMLKIVNNEFSRLLWSSLFVKSYFCDWPLLKSAHWKSQSSDRQREQSKDKPWERWQGGQVVDQCWAEEDWERSVVEEGEVHPGPVWEQERGDLWEVGEQACHALAEQAGHQREQAGEQSCPGGEGSSKEVVEWESSLRSEEEGQEGQKS